MPIVLLISCTINLFCASQCFGPDPHQDPLFHKYGSGSGSFHHQAKIVGKPWLLLFNDYPTPRIRFRIRIRTQKSRINDTGVSTAYNLGVVRWPLWEPGCAGRPEAGRRGRLRPALRAGFPAHGGGENQVQASLLLSWLHGSSRLLFVPWLWLKMGECGGYPNNFLKSCSDSTSRSTG